jgi:hypothetical protein
MSGRNREVPLKRIISSAQLVLVVDMGTLTKEQAKTTIIMPEASLEPSFEFSYALLKVRAVKLLFDNANSHLQRQFQLDKPISFISVAGQRSLHWNRRKGKDGARKIMYYDSNPAFEEDIKEDRALLLLNGLDAELKAYHAAMGTGLLAMAYLDELKKQL